MYTWSSKLSSFPHKTFGIFNIPFRSWFKRTSKPSTMQTFPFTFMAMSKEYVTHLFCPIVFKVTLLLQVDTSMTCAIRYWKCTRSILCNISLTCFNAHELKFLSFYILAWWNCDHNNNGSMFISTFLGSNARLAQEISLCTKVMWEEVLMISC